MSTICKNKIHLCIEKIRFCDMIIHIKRKMVLIMYYSEINKIIEAGLNKDDDKVRKYATLLASKLEEEGEKNVSSKINSILENKKHSNAMMDSLMAPPVDQESRMNIIDIDCNKKDLEIVLPESVKMKLKDFEDTIKIKDKMSTLGFEFNMSLLLYGAPGCGKTSLARYIANDLELPLVVARLDTLVSSLLGNTAKNIRKIFDYAKKQPCVLFLDEFDAIAKARDDKHEMGELKRVVNSLLQNMDEYCQNGILIAATNHHELLDDAIWRRFQSVIEIPKPREQEIEQMINQILASQDFALNEDVKKAKNVINEMLGFSYADIKNILQNVIKKKLINNNLKIDYIDILVEIYLFKNHGDFTKEELIQFLCTNAIPQTQTAKYFDVSVRQIRNVVGKKDE